MPPIVRKAIEANNAINAGNVPKRLKLDQPITAANLDADDAVDNDSSDDDSDSDDDDDTAALLAELNKIKQERLQENQKKEQEKKQEDERIRMENILSGNPLINYAPGSGATAAKSLGGDLKVRSNILENNCIRN